MTMLVGTSARADQPGKVKFDVDRTRTLSPSETGCAFDIVRHVEGTFYVTDFYDSSGSVTREVWLVSNYTVTDTNPLTGKSLTSRLAGPFIITPNADGTVTVTIPGNDGHLTAPGEGVLWSNVGLIIFTADPAELTPLSILAIHGLYTDLDGPYPESCPVLS
jgi:hypothetical protein